jgi:putative oxidoreductase
MGIFLWVLQILLAVMFLFHGYSIAFQAERSAERMTWINDVPRGLTVFIGTSELLGGLGLVLPALTGTLPSLTAWAAAGLALIMLLATLFHITRGEYGNLVPNLVLLALTAVTAYGRFALLPF